MWTAYKGGREIGNIGSENGVIVFDEEYDVKARITVEECERYHAITVGLYGVMVHTAFCGREEYEEMVRNMKVDIEEFYSQEHSLSEESEFCRKFYREY